MHLGQRTSRHGSWCRYGASNILYIASCPLQLELVAQLRVAAENVDTLAALALWLEASIEPSIRAHISHSELKAFTPRRRQATHTSQKRPSRSVRICFLWYHPHSSAEHVPSGPSCMLNVLRRMEPHSSVKSLLLPSLPALPAEIGGRRRSSV